MTKKTFFILAGMLLASITGAATHVLAATDRYESEPYYAPDPYYNDYYGEPFQLSDLNAYKQIYRPTLPKLAVPSRVAVQFPYHDPYPHALVLEEGSAQLEPMIWQPQMQAVTWQISESSPVQGDAQKLLNARNTEGVLFDLDADGGAASAVLRADAPITANGIELHFVEFTTPPTEVAVSVREGENWKTVLARVEWKKLESKYMLDQNTAQVQFPLAFGSEWKIEMWHSQPLHLTQLGLMRNEQFTTLQLVWLARPGANYLIYVGSDSNRYIPLPDSYSLEQSTSTIVQATLGEPSMNTEYVASDDDKDGVPSDIDNCPSEPNADQVDRDKNGYGDACDDHDGDGYIDGRDNCPEHANADQRDRDGDGMGDTCDTVDDRLTEQQPWITWATLGLAVLVLLGVVVRTLKSGTSTGQTKR